ncbi:sensor histidine kinase [Microbacterium kunmingense]|uniref:sensor histidine kinase n=1 Tax=Microbacterium kunmingense TaxID=2915939 RepID=UPI002006000A|nr:HAMP domain-containing sensor histidine kinase [Microbacterium kunmingense]
MAPATDWRRTVARPAWRSVRARTTLAATVVVAVVLIVGAVAFFQVLRTSVSAASERAATTRAEELADRIESEGYGTVTGLDDEIVQIVAADGRVVAASEEAEGEILPLSDDPRVAPIDDDPVLFVSEDLDDDLVLVVGVPIDDDTETLGTVGLLLGIAVPLIVGLVAATTWFVVARALRPVARIQAQVAGITADRLEQRVPVPDSGDEIAALAVTMNGMLDRLDASAQAQRRFISDASHELRSPLSTIRQHAELAQTHPQAMSMAELAEVVRDEGLRLQGLVDALLLLARLDEAPASSGQPVDLDDLALAEAVRLRAAGHEVDAAGVGAARVQGDPQLLAQLVRNLADNAARHARGRIAISVEQRGSHATLTVEDDGDGVPVADRDRVFERFVRLDEARARDDGGAGLGLAIVRGIATSSRGDVTLGESRWGGARFTVTLPAAS